MAAPLITFKAGQCEKSGRRILPLQTPGYLYLTTEDDLIHLCWRPRSSPHTEPETDLITIPGDATFTPLVKEAGAEDVRSPTNGRIFVLKFSSSGEKHYFWMQAKSQHSSGDADWFSQRDQRLGQIVDAFLQGDEVDLDSEVRELRGQGGNGGGSGSGAGGGEEDLMDLDRQETGGAGQDATGGDPREEGEASREGGADGGRA
jgi:26S proteasome regulatory subunit N13